MKTKSLVETRWAESVAVVRLDRPKALNALSADLVAAIGDALDEAQCAEGVTGIVLSTTTGRAFSAGADKKRISAATRQQFIVANRRGGELFQRIEEFPFPVVAAVQGYALGGGFELALACDARFASENAVFGLPEIGVGFVPGWGGIRRLAASIGVSRAKHLVLTGESIDAEHAEQLGLLAGPVTADPESAAVDYLRGLPDERHRSIAMAKHIFARYVNESESGNLETLFVAELIGKE